MLRESVPYLQAAHAIFNGLLLPAFGFQGWVGWRIRRARSAAGRPDIESIRGHRRLGRVLSPLLTAGYLAGLVLVVVDHGDALRYPLHLLVGTALLLVLWGAVLASGQIRAQQSPWRTRHALLGLATLLLFVLQVVVGLGVLF